MKRRLFGLLVLASGLPRACICAEGDSEAIPSVAEVALSQPDRCSLYDRQAEVGTDQLLTELSQRKGTLEASTCPDHAITLRRVQAQMDTVERHKTEHLHTDDIAALKVIKIHPGEYLYGTPEQRHVLTARIAKELAAKKKLASQARAQLQEEAQARRLNKAGERSERYLLTLSSRIKTLQQAVRGYAEACRAYQEAKRNYNTAPTEKNGRFLRDTQRRKQQHLDLHKPLLRKALKAQSRETALGEKIEGLARLATNNDQTSRDDIRKRLAMEKTITQLERFGKGGLAVDEHKTAATTPAASAAPTARGLLGLGGRFWTLGL